MILSKEDHVIHIAEHNYIDNPKRRRKVDLQAITDDIIHKIKTKTDTIPAKTIRGTNHNQNVRKIFGEHGTYIVSDTECIKGRFHTHLITAYGLTKSSPNHTTHA